MEEQKKDEYKSEKKEEIKITKKNLSTLIKEKLEQLQDLATMEVMLDIPTRLKHRIESIQKASRAKHMKIMGQWKTTPPDMHISNLEAVKISNDEGEITFKVYQADDDKNKVLHKNYVEDEIEDEHGNLRTRKRLASAEYKIELLVRETIRRGKPIQREVINLTK